MSVSSIGGLFSVDSDPHAQCVCLIFGESGCGKSAFALGTPGSNGNWLCAGAPGPIAVLNLDGRDGDVVNKARAAGKVVHRARIVIPAEMRSEKAEVPTTLVRGKEKRTKDELDDAVELALNTFWVQFRLAVSASLTGAVRTIVIDTGAELSNLSAHKAKGHLGGQKDFGRSKARVNLDMQRLYLEARRGKAHLIVLARSKDEYKNDNATGQQTIVGNMSLWEFADWVGELSLRRGKVSKSFEGFQIKMRKSGCNIHEEGKVYTDKDWGVMGPFVYCCMKQYTTAKPSNWVEMPG